MKKLFFILILLVSVTILVNAQKKEARNVSTFNGVNYGLPGKLYLTQGSQQKVELEGPEEVLNKVKTEIRDNKLVITSTDKFNWKSEDKITVYVTVKDINSIYVSGSGNVTGQNKFITGDLDVKVSGSGSLSAEFAADGNIDADVSGSGKMELKGSGKNFDSNLSGSGRLVASIVISGDTDLNISGSGKIEASGSTQTLEARLSGSGEVKAVDMEADKCTVRISGSGNAEVNAKTELDARISGSGNVNYKGSPAKVNSQSSGSGKVRKL